MSTVPQCKASLQTVEPIRDSGYQLRELVIVDQEPIHVRTLSSSKEITNTEIFDHLTDLLNSLSETPDCLTSVTYLKGTSALRPIPYLIASLAGISSKDLPSLDHIFLDNFCEYKEQKPLHRGTIIKLNFTGKNLPSDKEIPFSLALKESVLRETEKLVLLTIDDTLEPSVFQLHFLKGTYRISHPLKTLDLLKSNPNFDHIYLQRLEPFGISDTLSYYKATFAYELHSETDRGSDTEDDDEIPVKINPLPTFDVYLYPISQ